jgi:hypothetical protein
MSLWRFEFFVEGKHLEQVLEAVSDVALNMLPPQMVGPVPQKGKVRKQQAPVIKGIKDKIFNALRGKPLNSSLTAGDFKDLIEELGASGDSYSHFIQAAVKEGLMKSRGRGHYIITNGDNLNGQG